MIVENGLVYTPDHTFREEALFVEGETIATAAQGERIDASGCYVIPGLVDLHLHGCVGHDFCDGTPEAISAMADYLAENGITAFHPATMTLSEEELEGICRTAAAWQGSGAIFCGITMEGPFFNEAKKGAQNAAYLRPPDKALYHRLQEASGNRIGIVCIAPELEGALSLIQDLSPECRISLGHTAADYETAVKAFQAGASHVTHLFNAMPPFSHREPGIIGAAADEGAEVELICDGIHLHPSMVRSVVKLFGPEKVVLISDSMRATGLGDGNFTLGGQDVTVKDGKALLANGSIAGSAVNLMDCLRNAVSFGISLEDVVGMATENPARAIGRSGEMGSLEPGKLANFVLLDQSLSLQGVYLRGKRVV